MKETILHQPLGCFAAWNNDSTQRHRSASGGMVTIFSTYVVEKLDGVVYGVALDSSLRPVYQRAETSSDLLRFQGSRYVQAHIGNTFKMVRDDLESGRFVLFVGLPCRVSALLRFLKTDYSRLLTVDLVCHGACPATYFEEEIHTLITKKKLHGIDDVRFRSNDEYNYHLTLWSEGHMIYSKPARKQFYYLGFLEGVTLGQKCYECPFQVPERTGDISAGDFIGLGKDTPFPGNTDNVSLILTNSVQGMTFYKNVVSFFPHITSIKRSLSEAVQSGASLNGKAPRCAKKHQCFLGKYRKYGFSKAIRITLSSEMLCYVVKLSYRRIHHFMHIIKTKIR